ncbi:MAG: hypothetical protein BMS9Abin37_0147 [Acidobacteriota bacterium]|nr:MAG: hypothetical protein BMS9Abin37_0147 [Acidobacteriota bacterium]
MRVTRTIALLVTTLALSVGLAFSQSLAEIAKKEKERRDTNKTESKTVITDRELTQSFGRLPATRSSSSSADEDTEAANNDTAEGQEDEVDETKTREYWQNRIGGAKKKIAKLESELNDGDWGEGQAFGVDPWGPNNLATRQQSEQKLQAARAELEAIRAEARRAGAPPGWVR